MQHGTLLRGIHALPAGIHGRKLEILRRRHDGRTDDVSPQGRAGIRHLGHRLHQHIIYGARTAAAAPKGQPHLCRRDQMDIRRAQFGSNNHQSGRLGLFPIHQPPHDDDGLQGILKRRQPRVDIPRRNAVALVSGAAGRSDDPRAVQALPRLPHTRTLPPHPLLCLPAPEPRHRRGPHHSRHEGRVYDGCAPHHGEQCQPVCQPSHRDRAGAQHAILALPHHRQGCLRRAFLLRQPCGIGAGLHAAAPCV